MAGPGDVSLNQPRRGKSIGIGGNVPMEPRPTPPPPGNPLDWYPGENSDAPSTQARSWIDAGQGLKDFFGGVGNWWAGLQAEAEANPPSVQDILLGTGTEVRNNPLGLSSPSWDATKQKVTNNSFDQFDDQRDRRGMADLRANNRSRSNPADSAAPEDTQSTTDWLQIALDYLNGGPDYGAYRESITGQASDLNSQIQAMYKQLADSAGQNAEQIQGTYDTAIQGIGAGYDTANQNVTDAYTSAQQNAADQFARLGIQEAAPGVINPMALAQAEAVSSLEQGRGSGLAAANRYGATAGGFGQQMAQVAQQQGVEQNSSLLNSLQRRLSDSQLQQTQAEYDSRLRAPGMANELYGTTQIGMPAAPSIDQQIKAQQIELDLRSDDLRAQQDAQQAQTDLIVQLGTQPGGTIDVEKGLAAYQALVAALAG
jgi:hypothetical protein